MRKLNILFTDSLIRNEIRDGFNEDPQWKEKLVYEGVDRSDKIAEWFC